MKKIFLTLLALSFSFSVFADDYIYKSGNKIDFVKLSKASGDEKNGGLKHPTTFTPEQIRSILKSIHFNKKVILSKTLKDSDLFRDTHVDFLTPYIIEAFNKATPDKVVVISFFSTDTMLVVQDNRLTILRAYVKDDGLHFKFSKLYAKMLGDRTTMGKERAMQEAKSLGTSLEVQTGQNRISWDPEELVFDLNHFGPAGETSTAVVEPTSAKDKKAAKEKKIVEEKAKDAKYVPVKKDESAKPIRDRLKELDQLKKDELITEDEYKKKKKELLDQL